MQDTSFEDTAKIDDMTTIDFSQAFDKSQEGDLHSTSSTNSTATSVTDDVSASPQSCVMSPPGDFVTTAKRFGKKRKPDTGFDKSIECIGQYFSTRMQSMQTLQQSGNSQAASNQDEDTTFSNCLAFELKKLTNSTIKRRLKKSINDLVYEALEQQEEFERKEQSVQLAQLADFFVTQS